MGLLENYYKKDAPTHQDGCRILDATRIPLPQNIDGVSKVRRTEPVYQWIAQKGDVFTINPGTPDAKEMTARGGEIVFIKRLGGDQLKVYVPSDNGGALSEEKLAEKYEPAEACYLREDDPVLKAVPEGRTLTIRLPRRDLTVLMLVGAIEEPTIILNTRGEGNHQIFAPGDSLKFEDNQWVGVRQTEMKKAWEVVTETRNSQSR